MFVLVGGDSGFVGFVREGPNLETAEEFLPQVSFLLVEDTQTGRASHVSNKWMVMISLEYVVMLWREVF